MSLWYSEIKLVDNRAHQHKFYFPKLISKLIPKLIFSKTVLTINKKGTIYNQIIVCFSLEMLRHGHCKKHLFRQILASLCRLTTNETRIICVLFGQSPQLALPEVMWLLERVNNSRSISQQIKNRQAMMDTAIAFQERSVYFKILQKHLVFTGKT